MLASPAISSLGRALLWIAGWRHAGTAPAFRKYVVVAAPHTSNWDGFYFLLGAAALKLTLSYFGKVSLFWGPLGWLMRATGGIPLDRSRRQGLVAQAIAWFDSSETFAMGLAPEGTRQRSAGWRTGFYHIALQAKVPIVLGYVDYAKKEVGILPEVLVPTGDIDKDFALLRRLYEPMTARHPDDKSPIVPLRE